MAIQNDVDWDLAVTDREGHLALAIEVKGKTNVSLDWVVRLRHQMLGHLVGTKPPYFLIAFPDKFHLWKESESELLPINPTYTIDALPILEPYLKRSGLRADQISGQSLEIIISSWLGAIIHYAESPENLKDSQPWLIESGLYAAVVGGRFDYEAVA
jgi:hypothetical protein